jgi:transposase
VNRFVFPELDAINQAAYWDYQRDKVYIRSSQRLKRVTRKRPTNHTISLPANTVITYPSLDRCPTCGSSQIMRQHRRKKLTYDLKFGHGSLKRWIVKHMFHRFRCSQCNGLFDLKQQDGLERRYGPNILAYITYQLIELRIPQTAITEVLNQLFHFHMERTTIHRQKAIMAQRYKSTYERIIKRIVMGQLVHADETKVTIQARDEYVWVITNLEEVAYFHTETREGDKLYTLLNDFQGVVVSDFYAVYDSLKCCQQKCLIHLIRDMNEDVRREPFNEELKALVQDFAQLLKIILETVDRFGLKAYFLRKHREDVERFYEQLLSRIYTSEIARKYQKRLEKNRDKLFTFLDHDGVPWNNNNAEHAVKAFAMLRRVIRATSTKSGIDDYLILLSVCETCRCKGVSFFDFLCSGERDIDMFLQKQKYRPKGEPYMRTYSQSSRTAASQLSHCT